MGPKMRYDLLKKAQKLAFSPKNNIQMTLYQNAYKKLSDMKQHVIKPFKNICVHGNFPQLALPFIKSKQNQSCKVWAHCNTHQESKQISFLNSDIPFNNLENNQQFDLIVSCLEGHHYDMGNLFESYLKRLTPDGAVIGCCWAQNTLKQLRWSCMMAQNQRSGGISPKVFGFQSIGGIGHSLVTAQFKMPTILVQDYQIEVDSVIDILTILSMFGETGSLSGRRKGTYQDVLLATCALYDSQFRKQNQQKKTVSFSLQMAIFIGWKQHQSQPKPLKRGKVLNNSFFHEILKNDNQAKIYTVNQGSDIPVQVDINKTDQNSNSLWTGDENNKDKKQ